MKSNNTRDERLRELLESGDEACIAYLNASFEDGDVHYFLMALRKIIEVHYDSLDAFAQEFSIDSGALKKLFSEENVNFFIINNTLQSFGWSFVIQGTTMVTLSKPSPIKKQDTLPLSRRKTHNDPTFQPMYAKSNKTW